jgi:hypothetical protein
MRMRSQRTSGSRGPEGFGLATAKERARCAALVVALLLSGAATSSCIYSFSQGGLPSNIKTIAVLPFENETTRLELTQELHDALLREVPRSLGVRTAGEDVANAVLRGRITSYEVTVPNYRASADGDRAEVLQRQVSVTVAVEIVDLTKNEIIWENRALIAQGEFLEASETEETGLAIAIRLLRQRIVDGAQSNW